MFLVLFHCIAGFVRGAHTIVSMTKECMDVVINALLLEWH